MAKNLFGDDLLPGTVCQG